MQFGLNLAGVVYYTSEFPFADLFRYGEAWISQQQGKPFGQGPALTLDKNGYPVSLQPGCSAEAHFCNHAGQYWPGATIRCTYSGNGVVDFGIGAKTVSKSPGLVIGQIVSPNLIYMSIHQTDPTNPVRNISVLSPDIVTPPIYTAQPFRQPFLSRWSMGFIAIRLMDWLCTNNSTLANWSDRPLQTDCFWDSARGVPLEICLEAARRLNASPWVNVPHLATDDYVYQMAKLVAAHLKPWQKCYVEYSNECWNNMFHQAGYCQQQGLTLGLSTNAYEAQLRFYSQRAVEVFNIFTEVVGATNLVRVMGAQYANPWTSKTVLGWQNAFASCDALAVAPYFGSEIFNAKNAVSNAATTVPQILAMLRADIQSNVALTQKQAAIASQYKLQLVAYEQGQSLEPSGGTQDLPGVASLIAACNRDPGMKDLYLQDFANWQSAGGGLYNLFTSMGGPSKWGSWGLLEDETQDLATAPKMAAVKQFLSV